MRGVTAEQEQRGGIDIRRTDPITVHIARFMLNGYFPLIFVSILFFLMLALPGIAEILFVLGLILFPVINLKQQKYTLPFKLPETSKRMDLHEHVGSDPNSGSIAKGTVFIGNELTTNDELWTTDSDIRTHVVMFGTTGAGKAFLLDELFLTKRGWVKNRDLKVGDEIMTPFGTYSKVTALFLQPKQRLLKMSFANGLTKIVSHDHLWEYYSYVIEDKDNFTDFRNDQRYRLTETYALATILTRGEQVFIPFVERQGGIDVPLGNYTLKDVGCYFCSFLRNSVIDETNPLFKLIHQIVSEGSLTQRKTILSSLNQCLLSNKEHLTTFAAKDGVINKYYSTSSFFLEVLRDLYISLGYEAILKEDIHGKYQLSVKKVFYVELVKIEEVEQEEDCQCIKLEDERGLLVLDNGLVSHNTEAILSLLTNAFIQGSGFIFIDGKGDTKTVAQVFSLCRAFRREDDLLVISYLTSGKDMYGKQEFLPSNTLNPLVSNSASGLTELIVGLLDSGGAADPMWQGRAIALISCIMVALVYMRDNENYLLDIEKLRDNLILSNIFKLAERQYGGIDMIGKAITAYLQSIPGYKAGTPIDKQEPVVAEQHGYLQMQFFRVLSSLTDTYGHIYKTNLGHINFKDVVLNRRFLFVGLPALEKSEPELQNLGKMVVGSIKAMMASTLGSSMDGDYEKDIENRPTNAPSAFYTVFDEYGYYIVKGSAVMPAQARSLGFAMIFAGQDVPSFQKNNNREEASSIIANCNLKIFMKVEDPGETLKLLKDSAGQVLVQVTRGRDLRSQEFIQSYMDQTSVSYEKRDRVDGLDAKDQFNGMAHFITKSSLVRGRFFFTNPEKAKKYRVNYFIKVEPPKYHDVIQHFDVVRSLQETLEKDNGKILDDLKFSVEKNYTLDSLFTYFNIMRKNVDIPLDSNQLSSGAVLYLANVVNTDADEAMRMLLDSVQSGGNKQTNIFGSENRNSDVYADPKEISRQSSALTDVFNIPERTKDSQIVQNISALTAQAQYPSRDEGATPPDDIDSATVSSIVQDLTEALTKE